MPTGVTAGADTNKHTLNKIDCRPPPKKKKKEKTKPFTNNFNTE